MASLDHRPGRVGRGLLGSLIVVTALANGCSSPGPALVITADQPSAVPAGHNWGFQDFFPRTLTIAVGSTLGFKVEPHHTATLLPSSTSVAQDLAGASGAAPDAPGSPLNPNGTTRVIAAPSNANAPVPATGCGGTANPCSFDGTSIVSSGLPTGSSATLFAVTITAPPGAYIFHCRVHPKMAGVVTVVPTGGVSTTPDQLNSAVATQVAADVAAATATEAAANTAGQKRNADGTTTWSLTAGTETTDGFVDILEMLPHGATIKAGDTVTWRSVGTNEPHTVTFPTNLHTTSVAFCETGTIDVPAASTCPAGSVRKDVLLPGNGVSTVSSPATVSDSGLLTDPGAAAARGLPASAVLTSWTVHFTGASGGAYPYVCQIHDHMDGVIAVVP